MIFADRARKKKAASFPVWLDKHLTMVMPDKIKRRYDSDSFLGSIEFIRQNADAAVGSYKNGRGDVYDITAHLIDVIQGAKHALEAVAEEQSLNIETKQLLSYVLVNNDFGSIEKTT